MLHDSAMSRISDLTDRVSKLSHAYQKLKLESRPRVHGNGFIQFDLSRELRLHVWGHEAIPAQKSPSPIHDHTFSFTSYVLKGKMTNREIEIEDDPDGDYELHQAVLNVGQDTKLQATGRRVALRRTHSQSYSAGERYSMEPRVFHESIIEEPTITIIDKIGSTLFQGGPSPRVLVPVGQAPDNEFNRYSEDESTLWNILREVLQS